MGRIPNRAACDLSLRRLQRLYTKNIDAIGEAEDLFEEFYQRPPEGELFACMRWPAPQDQIMLGIANRIGYRSDKWEDEDDESGERTEWDYIHQHKVPDNPDDYPLVVMERPSMSDWRDDLEPLFTQPSLANPIVEPDPFVFTILGKCLDIEYIRNGAFGTLDYKPYEVEQGRLPWLASNREGTMLLVFFDDLQEAPVIIYGSLMSIDARGLID